jgi:hypothetical protein
MNDPGFGPPRSDQKTDNFKVKEVPPMIHVYKFEDLDGDGVKDAGEPMLTGWEITILETLFDGIENTCYTPCWRTVAPNSTVTVTEIFPAAGWHVSYLDLDGFITSPSVTIDVTFAPGDTEHTVTFGNWEDSEKSGLKFEDQDADGVNDADPADPGLKDWRIFVDYDNDGVRDAGEPYDDTDADGKYTITGIVPGTWTVREELQINWICSFPNPVQKTGAPAGVKESSNCTYSETFTSGSEKFGNDFGNWTPGTKEGTKYEDTDADGSIADETKTLQGWTIYVDYDGDGVNDADEPDDVTDINGDYKITGIVPGTWRVKEVGQANWTCSYPNAGTETAPVTSTKCYHQELFKSNSEFKDNDFGNWTPGDWQGFKCIDLDGDGECEAGEPPVAGFTFYVDLNGNGQYDAGEPMATTDGTGFATISGIPPGNYDVRELVTDGFACTGAQPAGGSVSTSCFINEQFVSGRPAGTPDGYFANIPLEGCTPGYWKQEQHFFAWTAPYEPDSSLLLDSPEAFYFLFGSGYCGEIVKLDSGGDTELCAATLLQGIEFNGGDHLALLRHGSAALLNAASPDVHFGLTPADVRCIVADGLGLVATNDTCPAPSLDVSGAHTLLAMFNESKWPPDYIHNCPLGNDPN